MSERRLEAGLNSFGDLASDEGRRLGDAETIRPLFEEIQLAEHVGLGTFGVGEHYRTNQVDSATLHA